MKKIFFVLLFSSFISFSSFAQIPSQEQMDCEMTTGMTWKDNKCVGEEKTATKKDEEDKNTAADDDKKKTDEGLTGNSEKEKNVVEKTEEAKDAEIRRQIQQNEAVQQDFIGVIPASGMTHYDRDGNPVGDVGEKNKDGTVELDDIYIILIRLMDLGAKLAGTVAVVFLMYGGFQYIMSEFTDEKENAKNTIKYALIGLVVTFMGWIIITIVKTQMTNSADEYQTQQGAVIELNVG